MGKNKNYKKVPLEHNPADPALDMAPPIELPAFGAGSAMLTKDAHLTASNAQPNTTTSSPPTAGDASTIRPSFF